MEMDSTAAANYASNWFNVQNVPKSYVFPEEVRPGELPPVCHMLPVIDIAKSVQADTVQHIMKASREFGFFQVINHGVPAEILRDTAKVLRDFFEMPEKESSDTGGKSNWVYGGSTSFTRNGFDLWRENLKHPCYPLKDCMEHWPEKPTGYREVVSTYVTEVSKLGNTILQLISRGLGLEVGYFDGISGVEILSANNYPPCPDPSLTLGVLKHHDPSLITILYQGNVPGLQVLKDGVWISVGAMQNAFVVNIGNQLEIISNGIVRSALHRAVTNSSEARLSIAAFINPSPNFIVEPAQALVTELSPAQYKPTLYKEFVNGTNAFGPHTKAMQRA